MVKYFHVWPPKLTLNIWCWNEWLCVIHKFCIEKSTIHKILIEYLGTTRKGCRSIKPALSVLTQEHKEEMTIQQCHAFKVTFVIYV